MGWKQALGLGLGLGVAVIGYQNCAPVHNGGNESSLGQDWRIDPSLWAEATVILQSKCAGCHNSHDFAGGFGDLTDVDYLLSEGLIVPQSPESSLLYQIVRDDVMPYDQPLSDSEKEMLYHFISDGFQVVGNIVYFDEVDAGILQPYCVTCHNAENLTGRNPVPFSLENYEDVILTVTPGRPDESLLLEAVRNGDMPPGSVLSSELIGLLELWIDGGALPAP